MLEPEPLNRVLGCATWAATFLLQMALLPCSLSLLPGGSLVIIKQKERKLRTPADCSVFHVYAETAQIYLSLPSQL